MAARKTYRDLACCLRTKVHPRLAVSTLRWALGSLHNVQVHEVAKNVAHLELKINHSSAIKIVDLKTGKREDLQGVAAR